MNLIRNTEFFSPPPGAAVYTLPPIRVSLLAGAVLMLMAFAPGVRAQNGDPLLAEINAYPLRLSEVESSIASLPLGDQVDARMELPTYVEAMINEEVLFQYVLSQDFAGAGNLRQRIKEQVVEHMVETLVRQRIHVNDAEVRAYYDENPSQVRGEHVRVRQILLPKRHQCEDLMVRIDSETMFILMAQQYSLDEATAARGGDSGLLMRAEGATGGHELEYFRMKSGEMQIFDVPRGCLLVRQVLHINPPLPPFEAVAGKIRKFLYHRKESRLLEELFAKARAAVPVKRHYSGGEFP